LTLVSEPHGNNVQETQQIIYKVTVHVLRSLLPVRLGLLLLEPGAEKVQLVSPTLWEKIFYCPRPGTHKTLERLDDLVKVR
jgi:hypothetical protein